MGLELGGRIAPLGQTSGAYPGFIAHCSWSASLSPLGGEGRAHSAALRRVMIHPPAKCLYHPFLGQKK